MSDGPELRDIYNDIVILSRELEIINRKIELIEVVQYYSYTDYNNHELYYYSYWKNIILETLERLERD
jgi:hypothetical protein